MIEKRKKSLLHNIWWRWHLDFHRERM